MGKKVRRILRLRKKSIKVKTFCGQKYHNQHTWKQKMSSTKKAPRFAIEAAKSGRSSCKKCKIKIQNGELRMSKVRHLSHQLFHLFNFFFLKFENPLLYLFYFLLSHPHLPQSLSLSLSWPIFTRCNPDLHER